MPKILYVEDDPFIAEIYMRKFREAGVDAVNAVTGKDVLSLLKQDLYDAMLLDLVIPEMSGMDVLRELQNNPEYRGVNIRKIVFSNLSSQEDRQECLDLGADGFISKTELSPTQVVAEMQRFLHQFNEQNRYSERKEGNMSVEESLMTKKILFIDDELVFVDMFSRRLREEGYSVDVKMDGTEGLEAASENSYDLIISDVMMPGLQGHEMVEKLRDSEHGRHIPIFLFSASLEDQRFRELEESGIVHKVFMKLDMTPSKLAQEVSSFFRQSQ
jgi:CheY-like chemotaxis protein